MVTLLLDGRLRTESFYVELHRMDICADPVIARRVRSANFLRERSQRNTRNIRLPRP